MENLSKEQYLNELNSELLKHTEYEVGMKFMNIDKLGFHLMDPRLLSVQRGEREYNFSDKPFADAINKVNKKFIYKL